MTSGKARELRERLKIDPDAPEPVAPREPTPSRARPGSGPARTPARDDGAADVRPAPAAETPPARRSGAGPDAVSGEDRPTTAGTRRRETRGGRRAMSGSAPDPIWPTALEDPAVNAGGNGYRSFYVNDEVFARFRAAVYWTARRPDAPDAPANMSAGVQAYMDALASDLETRFNDGRVFPPTPDQYRSHRKRAERED